MKRTAAAHRAKRSTDPVRKMRNLGVCILIAAALIACDKDDDTSRNESEGVLYFRGYSEVEMLFWVGGEARDPSGLDLTKIFNATRRSWISAERYADHTYFFDGDTVEIFVGTAPPFRYGYEIENDTIYRMGINQFSGSVSRSYLAEGSTTELRTRQGLTYHRYIDENGISRRGGGFEVSRYNTPELMSAYTSFGGIDQMGENDSLLIINQTKLFN